MNKVLTLTAAVLAISACGQTQQGKQSAPADVTPNVRIIKAQKHTVSVDNTYSVTLQAFAVNNIAPQASGRIISIKAEIGDYVRKGQILAEMDRANLDQAELQLKNAESELARTKALYEKGGVSKADYETVELNYKVRESACRNLRDNTVLKSPLDGVITARNYDQGDMYSMSSPLFVVQQINPLKALVSVSEKDYSLLKKGVKAEIVTEALPGKVFDGQVALVHPTIDAATHTVTAEIYIPNAARELRPGMYGSAKVIFGSASRVLIPDSAIVKQQGSGVKAVFVLGADNTVTMRVVELGRHLNDQYEVLSGLDEGETIVTSGQSTLRNGTKVNVLE
ncbi:MAG: efflux RND transporter periplasmic adaptor subunit [Bacteroidales bacterium]|nr:efflux RND transporter periplasmic adaptor subunit [Bacteroidales bacterium]